MTTKNGQTKQNLQDFVKHRLAEAQKRIQGFEGEAEKALKNLVAKGKESRKELEGLVQKVSSGEVRLFDGPRVKELGKSAANAGADLKKRFDELQSRVVELIGAASQGQIRQINRELSRLTKKVDGLLGKKSNNKEQPSA